MHTASLCKEYLLTSTVHPYTCACWPSTQQPHQPALLLAVPCPFCPQADPAWSPLVDVGLMEDTEMPLPVPGYREPGPGVEVKHVPVKGKGYLHLQELARFRCVEATECLCASLLEEAQPRVTRAR